MIETNDPSAVTGKLYYIIGPSGSGKDSLLTAVRQRIAGSSLIFAHRYITRSAEAGGENFIALSDIEFQVRKNLGLFVMAWSSHNLQYGVGCEVSIWLNKGLSVIVNGSRAYLSEAQALMNAQGIELIPIWIHCDLPILAQRLIKRGRESSEEISERLSLAERYQAPSSAIVIDNSEELELAVTQFIRLVLPEFNYDQPTD